MSSRTKPKYKSTDPLQLYEVVGERNQILKIKVHRARNIPKTKMIGVLPFMPDPYVKLCVVGQKNSEHRTKTVHDCTDPVWEEEFEIAIAPTHGNRNQSTYVELVLMDNVSVPMHGDNQIGEKMLYDISHLQHGTSKRKTFKPDNEGIELIVTFNTEHKHLDIRTGNELCKEEERFRRSREQVVFDALQKLLGSDAPNNFSEMPTVAVMGSGGGYRAMIGLLGSLKALEEMRVWDVAMYLNGLSGSTWGMSALYTNESFPKRGVKPVADEIKQRISHNPWSLTNPVNFSRILHIMNDKWKFGKGQPITLTDFWGHIVGEHLLGTEKVVTGHLTDFKKTIEDGKTPMPIMASIHVKNKESALIYHDWMEYTPFEVGMSKYGVYVPTSSFNDQYSMGSKTREFTESPLHFMMGIWGSAFSILIDRILDEPPSKQAKLEGPENEYWMDQVESFLLNEIQKEEQRVNGNEQLLQYGPMSIWKKMYEVLFESRSFHAGYILNFMKELEIHKLQDIEDPKKWPQVDNKKEFVNCGEPMTTSDDKIFAVDAGIAYNSPYPTLLRAQRKVDVIISFDFSDRGEDKVPPFRELRLAEKWARVNHVPFPKINFEEAEKEMKECYVFRDENDDRVPTVLHFPMSNINFKHYSAPGVPREHGDNRGNFAIFDNKKTYSSFVLKYDGENFDNLFNLMHFNTMLNKQTIIDEIKKKVEACRRSPNRWE